MKKENNGKKKIAQVITRMDWAGSPDIVRFICSAADEGHEVILITGPSEDMTSVTADFMEKFRDNIVTVPELKRDIDPLNDITAFFRLFRIFRREKFDIIHVHTAKAGFLGRIAGKLAGAKKIIYMPHGHVFYGYFGSFMSGFTVFLERVAAFFTDQIIVLTELEKKDFLSLGIKTREDIKVIRSGIEEDWFKAPEPGRKERLKEELGIGREAIVVGMVSRLEPVKAPGFFMEAAEYIAEGFPEARFIVAGDGSLRKELEDKVAVSGNKDKVYFLGWRDDIKDVMSIMDVLVQPSLNEAVGRVLLEAQAVGVPVVATKVGGIPEIMRYGETGIMVPPENARAIADAVETLLSDEGKREKISDTARKWVRQSFSVDTMVKKIYGSYDLD